MTPNIAQPQNRVLRDAMHIAAQISDRARMNIDAAGIHIRARDDINTTMIWIEIPASALGAQYPPEHFPDELGVPSEKLYRMLNAYEAAATIKVQIIKGVGDNWIKISGTEGTLWTTDLLHVPPIPASIARIQARHPPVVSGDIGADYFRGWLKHIEDNEIAVSFRYEKGSGKFPIKTVSEHTGLLPVVTVLSHPDAPEDADSLQTHISLDLLQDAIAPPCIDGDLKFSFGDDTPLYITTKVSGCDVAIAIAPRIYAGEEIITDVWIPVCDDSIRMIAVQKCKHYIQTEA